MLKKAYFSWSIIYLFIFLLGYFINVTDGDSNGYNENNKQTEKSKPCGDYLTSSRGIISTPNFPGQFSVPIKCRWVIDATEIRLSSTNSDNTTIVVYLTQLYVYKGLRFTEYAYYDSPESTNFGPIILKDVTEGNVFDNITLETNRPFLVIEFELERLEGNHIRVLHDLLDVYGFNITYEITSPEEINTDSCSVKNCSFAGNCIVDTSFRYVICK